MADVTTTVVLPYTTGNSVVLIVNQGPPGPAGPTGPTGPSGGGSGGGLTVGSVVTS